MQAAGASVCAFVPSGSRAGARWFCAWTHPRDERRAHLALSQQGFDAYLPLRMDPRTKSIGSLFPGYLFIRFDADRDAWGVNQR
jgi:hypothetical protein